jgi:hypothetical protein
MNDPAIWVDPVPHLFEAGPERHPPLVPRWTTIRTLVGAPGCIRLNGGGRSESAEETPRPLNWANGYNTSKIGQKKCFFFFSPRFGSAHRWPRRGSRDDPASTSNTWLAKLVKVAPPPGELTDRCEAVSRHDNSRFSVVVGVSWFSSLNIA